MAVNSVAELAHQAKAASRAIAAASTAAKDAALVAAADLLVARASELLDANGVDVAAAEGAGTPSGTIDRLRLTQGRIESMAQGLRDVAALSDPVGRIVDGWVRPNGLRVSRVRVPLGVIGIVYENRPNVTSDAAGLCLKSGNAVLLRGSASALASNKVVAACVREALAKAGLPQDAVTLVEDTGHGSVAELVSLTGVVDCVIPRGGPGLVATVLEHARVPVVVDGDGNCHVYVDKGADLDMAADIVHNAKCQRPSVCNAMETLVVHADVAARFLPTIAERLVGVELVGDERARAILPSAAPATEDDYAKEFLALKLAIRVVDDLDGAIAHIRRYSTGHSEAIVTADLRAADRFVAEVDAAAVLVNCSTRFVDGGELGLGAEIGISTQKLHARGPMGLAELTSTKWVVRGEGQVRR